MSGLDLSLEAGVTFHDRKSGEDTTEAALKLIAEKCPELLEMFVHTEVFKPYGGGPKAMAEKYGIPNLGKLPLDPGLMTACEVSACQTRQGKLQLWKAR